MNRDLIDPGSTGEAITSDPLFERAASALGAETGRSYVIGACIPQALARLPAGGLLIACDCDLQKAAERIARATGLAPAAVARRGGVLSLTRTGERGVSLVPMAGIGIECLLGGASFTVMAMAVDLADPSSLIDPLGGAADLRGGVLRAASPVGADPARLLLAGRLRAQFGIEPDRETASELRACSKAAGGIEPRRVWRGLSGIFQEGGLASSASFLKDTGVLEILFPAVGAIYQVPQNYYHHLGVWDHTLETLANIEDMLARPVEHFKAYGMRVAAHLRAEVEGEVRRRELLVMAALVHDVGKAPSMTVEPSGRIRFQGHQREGAGLAAGIARRAGLGRRAERALVTVVREHMRLGFILKEGETTTGRLRAALELGPICPEVIMLSLADRMATRGEASTDEALQRFRRLAGRLLGDWFWTRDFPPLIDGRDVMLHTDAGPGPGVGEALLAARVAQRESTVSSRGEALEFLAPDFKGKMNMRGKEGEAR